MSDVLSQYAWFVNGIWGPLSNLSISLDLKHVG